MEIEGDCIEEMAKLDGNIAHSLVTDPPYNLSFMGKGWDSFKSGRKYEAWTRKWARQALRIMRPGAFGLVFGGPRTHHRLMCGLEDAGFEIRDVIMWIYVSGFPKGSDLFVKIDEHLGVESTKGAMKVSPDGVPYDKRQIEGHTMTTEIVYGKTVVNGEKWFSKLPTSDKAKQWYGYRSCLKPAWEPIILIRKPKIGTYVENMIEWDVGALNIDAIRIPINLPKEKDPRIHNQDKNFMRTTGETKGSATKFFEKAKQEGKYIQQLFDMKGRFPTNVIIDEMIAEYMNYTFGTKKRGKLVKNKDVNRSNDPKGTWNKETSGYFKSTSGKEESVSNYGDGGGLSKSFYTCPTTSVVYEKWGKGKRSAEHYGLKDGGGLGKFFYVPKAWKTEKDLGLGENKQVRDTTRNIPIDNPFNRNAPVKNFHPTVKPIKLMTYLIRMVKPPIEKPIILDPFGGSGSTIIACRIENCDWIYIEKNHEYVELMKARLRVPLKEYQRFTKSTISVETGENQTKLTDMEGWL